MPTTQACSQTSNSSDTHSSCHSTHDKINHTTIGLVSAFVLFIIILFLVLNLKRRRRSSQEHDELPFKMNHVITHKPKLWEVSLDNPASRWTAIEPGCDLQPVAAWIDEDGSLPPVTHIPAMDDDDLAMAQAWTHDKDLVVPERPIPPVFRSTPGRIVSDRRALNVAVLVAMPSPHLAKDHPSLHRHDTGPRLSFGDGQLMLGVACLPYKEQVILTALGDPKQTTRHPPRVHP